MSNMKNKHSPKPCVCGLNNQPSFIGYKLFQASYIMHPTQIYERKSFLTEIVKIDSFVKKIESRNKKNYLLFNLHML